MPCSRWGSRVWPMNCMQPGTYRFFWFHLPFLVISHFYPFLSYHGRSILKQSMRQILLSFDPIHVTQFTSICSSSFLWFSSCFLWVFSRLGQLSSMFAGDRAGLGSAMGPKGWRRRWMRPWTLNSLEECHWRWGLSVWKTLGWGVSMKKQWCFVLIVAVGCAFNVLIKSSEKKSRSAIENRISCGFCLYQMKQKSIFIAG